MFEIRLAGNTDLTAAEHLLSLCAPAHRDVRGSGQTTGDFNLYVAATDALLVGCAGLETFGDTHGLIRSVAVLPGFRKHQIGRLLLQRLLAHADQNKIEQLYVLTDSAPVYFEQMGFAPCPDKQLPYHMQQSALVRKLRTPDSVLLRHARHLAPEPNNAPGNQTAETARALFDEGYECAESVLMAIGRELGIDSPLLPRIATGLSQGMAGSGGTCGAVSGALLGLNLALGRSSAQETTIENYRAVRKLLGEFTRACGSIQCSELVACDLESKDGQQLYRSHHLHAQCREYVATAARTAGVIIQETLQKPDDRQCPPAPAPLGREI